MWGNVWARLKNSEHIAKVYRLENQLEPLLERQILIWKLAELTQTNNNTCPLSNQPLHYNNIAIVKKCGHIFDYNSIVNILQNVVKACPVCAISLEFVTHPSELLLCDLKGEIFNQIAFGRAEAHEIEAANTSGEDVNMMTRWFNDYFNMDNVRLVAVGDKALKQQMYVAERNLEKMLENRKMLEDDPNLRQSWKDMVINKYIEIEAIRNWDPIDIQI